MLNCSLNLALQEVGVLELILQGIHVSYERCRDISLMCGLSLQLELWTGHREMYPQGTEQIVSTVVPFPTLRYCEGGMGGTVSLVEMERME